MTDRSRWPDDRIEDLAEAVRELRPISKDVATALIQIANTSRDVEEIKVAIDKLSDKIDADARKRRESRTAIIVAAIAASATVLASMVAAIVAFVG